jgi:outer membrane receptor protein involved in Fe transport
MAAEISAGSHSTSSGSLFAAVKRVRLSADYFDTAGYVLVRPQQRGAVDRAADSRHLASDLTYQGDRFFVRASHYDESRNNGTPLQTNDTTISQLAAGADSRVYGGSLVGRGWVGDHDYQQTFSAIAADRNSERLTVNQRLSSRSIGGSMQWARPLGARHALLAGVEGQRVSAANEENESEVFARQRTGSGFVEDVFAATTALSVTAGLRYDSWRNFDAWSPRLAILYRAPRSVSFSASAYRAFRGPTLNELYRSFRVGNVLTLANDSLGPERLGAIELGVRARNVRATFFWMEMDDAVANVTISTTPPLITRRRMNVASSRSRGAEIEGDWRVGSSWRFSTGYLFTDSTLREGKRVPQVPRNQMTAQVLYSSRMNAGLQARWSGFSFDDDLNQLRLGSYFVVDLFASHPIARGFDVTLAAENLFDRAVEASATPVITLGTPRSLRIGLRYGR